MQKCKKKITLQLLTCDCWWHKTSSFTFSNIYVRKYDILVTFLIWVSILLNILYSFVPQWCLFFFALAHWMEVTQTSSFAVHWAVLGKISSFDWATEQLSDQQDCMGTVHSSSTAAWCSGPVSVLPGTTSLSTGRQFLLSKHEIWSVPACKKV